MGWPLAIRARSEKVKPAVYSTAGPNPEQAVWREDLAASDFDPPESTAEVAGAPQRALGDVGLDWIWVTPSLWRYRGQCPERAASARSAFHCK